MHNVWPENLKIKKIKHGSFFDKVVVLSPIKENLKTLS